MQIIPCENNGNIYMASIILTTSLLLCAYIWICSFMKKILLSQEKITKSIHGIKSGNHWIPIIVSHWCVSATISHSGKFSPFIIFHVGLLSPTMGFDTNSKNVHYGNLISQVGKFSPFILFHVGLLLPTMGFDTNTKNVHYGNLISQVGKFSPFILFHVGLLLPTMGFDTNTKNVHYGNLISQVRKFSPFILFHVGLLLPTMGFDTNTKMSTMVI